MEYTIVSHWPEYIDEHGPFQDYQTATTHVDHHKNSLNTWHNKTTII